jgi:hypothetical protein
MTVGVRGPLSLEVINAYFKAHNPQPLAQVFASENA